VDQPNHLCRNCGYVGEPNWVHWVQGMEGGYTPRCVECNAIVKTKREWYKDEYAEKTGVWFVPLFGLFTLLYIGGMSLPVDQHEVIENALGATYCFALLTTFLGFFLGERRYVRLREEE